MSRGGAVVPIVVVAEGLQVRLDVGAAELCGEGFDRGALGQGGGVGDSLTFLDVSRGRGELGPVGYVEEICSFLCFCESWVRGMCTGRSYGFEGELLCFGDLATLSTFELDGEKLLLGWCWEGESRDREGDEVVGVAHDVYRYRL